MVEPSWSNGRAWNRVLYAAVAMAVVLSFSALVFADSSDSEDGSGTEFNGLVFTPDPEGGLTASVTGYTSALHPHVFIPSTVTIEGQAYDVTEITSTAFSGCTVMESIFIPSTVETIGLGAFKECSSLRAFTVDSSNSIYSSDSQGLLYNIETDTLLSCVPRAWPETVLTIDCMQVDPYAVYNVSSLRLLKYDPQMTTLSSHAVDSCSSLSAIIFTDDVDVLDDDVLTNLGDVIFCTYSGNEPQDPIINQTGSVFTAGSVFTIVSGIGSDGILAVPNGIGTTPVFLAPETNGTISGYYLDVNLSEQIMNGDGSFVDSLSSGGIVIRDGEWATESCMSGSIYPKVTDAAPVYPTGDGFAFEFTPSTMGMTGPEAATLVLTSSMPRGYIYVFNVSAGFELMAGKVNDTDAYCAGPGESITFVIETADMPEVRVLYSAVDTLVPSTVTVRGGMVFSGSQLLELQGYIGDGGIAVIPDMVGNYKVDNMSAVFSSGPNAIQASRITSLYIDKSTTDELILTDGAFSGLTGVTTMIIEGAGGFSVGGDDTYAMTSLTAIEVYGDFGFTSEDGILYGQNGNLLLVPAGRTDTEYAFPDTVTIVSSSAFRGNTHVESVTFHYVTKIGDDVFVGCSGLDTIRFEVDVNTASTTIGSNLYDTGMTVKFYGASYNLLVTSLAGLDYECYYTGVYDPNYGGAEPFKENYLITSTPVYITLPSDPGVTRTDGYVLSTWNNPRSGSVMGYPGEVMSGSTETPIYDFVANYELSETIVLMDVMGGDPINGPEVTYGDPINDPYLPTYAGHTFGGFYLEDTFQTRLFDETGTIVELQGYYEDGKWAYIGEELTVYAKWSGNLHTVDFSTLGGSAVSQLSVTYGSPVTGTYVSSRDGYTFGGFYLEDTYRNQLFDGAGTIQTVAGYYVSDEWVYDGDLTVYAKWTALPFQLTYMIGSETYSQTSVDCGTTVTLPTGIVKTGYTLGPWTSDDVVLGETTFVMPANDVTVSCTATPNNYDLLYTLDGEEAYSFSIAYGSEVTVQPLPVKTGYTVGQWNYPQSITVTDGKFTMPAEAVTITSTSTINSYTLSYIFDGQPYDLSGNGGPSAGYQSVQYNTLVTLAAKPTKTGYDVTDWQSDDVTVSVDGTFRMPDKDVTFYSTSSPATYTVTYTADHQTDITQSHTYEESVTVLAVPTLEGYTYSAWVSGQVTPVEGVFTMPAGDVVFTSTATANTYDVIYNFDGEKYAGTTADYGTNVAVQTKPSKYGYTVSDWQSDDVTVSQDGTFTMPAGNVTFNSYSTPIKSNVTYRADFKTDVVLQFDYGTSVTVSSIPEQEGYTYSAWTSEQVTPVQGVFTMPAEDVLFTSTATANTYDVLYNFDGSKYAGVTATFGSTVTLQPKPERYGYTVSDWVSEQVTPVDGSFTMIAGNVTFNSYSTPLKFSVTYRADLKTDVVLQFDFESSVTVAAVPEQEGYTYSDWVSEQVTPVQGVFTMPAEDVLFTSAATANTYDVMYNFDGEKYAGVTATFGSTVTLQPKPERYGYTVSDWVSEQVTPVDGSFTMIAGNVTFNSYSTPLKFSVTYRADLKTDVVIQVGYDTTVTVAGLPMRKGYSYSEWVSEQVQPIRGIFTMPAEDVLFTSTATLLSYGLIYLMDDKIYHSEEVPYGTEVTLPSKPVKSGYTVSDWYSQSVTPVDGKFTMPAFQVEFSCVSTQSDMPATGEVPVFGLPEGLGVTVVGPLESDSSGFYRFRIVTDSHEMQISLMRGDEELYHSRWISEFEQEYIVPAVGEPITSVVTIFGEIEFDPNYLNVEAGSSGGWYDLEIGQDLVFTVEVLDLPGTVVVKDRGQVILPDADGKYVIPNVTHIPRISAVLTETVTRSSGEGYVISGADSAAYGSDYEFGIRFYSNFPGSSAAAVVTDGDTVLVPVSKEAGALYYRIGSVSAPIDINVRAGIPVALDTGPGYTLYGPLSVLQGEDYSFVLTYDCSKYLDTNLLVRAVGVGTSMELSPVSSIYTDNIITNEYLIEDLSAAVSIVVTGLEPMNFSVSYSQDDSRYTTEGPSVVPTGGSFSFKVTPMPGFTGVLVVTYDDNRVLLFPADDGVTYTIEGVDEDIEVVVYAGYPVSLPGGYGLTVTGDPAVSAGEIYRFRVDFDYSVPDISGFRVLFNGIAVDPVSSSYYSYSYAVGPVETPSVVSVTGVDFISNLPVSMTNCTQYRISGMPYAVYGEDYTFTVTGDSKYDPVVTVNGEFVIPDHGVYTVPGVTEPLAVSVDVGFNIELPSRGQCVVHGASAVYYGKNYSFTVDNLPNGYDIYYGDEKIIPDENGVYTINNMVADAPITIRSESEGASLVPAVGVGAVAAVIFGGLVFAVRRGLVVI